MSMPANNTKVARQVELIIRKLTSLSTLPQIATGFLKSASSARVDVERLIEVIESDPALTAKIFSLAHDQQITFTDDKPSIRQAIAKLPIETVRDSLLSIKVFQAFDANYDPDDKSALPRKQLALHALATACCAKRIADIALAENERPLAFSAGLLHDIGKLAIADVMPKSFEKIAAEAQTRNESFMTIEHEHLGLDHTIIGKRLGEKWHLPEEIVLGIWLHHSDMPVIADTMPQTKIAQVVSLADIIARRCGIGSSGSFSEPEGIDEIAESLGISKTAIAEIEAELAEDVAQKSELLGFTLPEATGAYCDLVSATAAKLAAANTELNAQNRHLSINSASTALTNEFVLSVTPSMLPADVALSFAASWQKHYQTGPVAVYLCQDQAEKMLEVAILDDNAQPITSLVDIPDGISAIDKKLAADFGLYDAKEHCGWIFDRIDVKFDLDRTKILPLLAHGKAAGVIIFEQRVPGDIAAQTANLQVCSAIVGGILSLAFAARKQAALAEQFARAISQIKDMRGKVADVTLLSSVAEMAAGAAHELNNPLAVISGRIQLLYDVEKDENKKNMLKQIQQRADEISHTVNDLMMFARPKKPVPSRVSVLVLADGAVEKVRQSRNLKEIEVAFDRIEDLKDVAVDTGQVVTAIANIVANSLDSYKAAAGPIEISAACPQSQGSITLQIIDKGCGMDKDMLARASQPFFSAKPAGRNKGMGLAHSQRLLLLNNGKMQIASSPEKGTCVTITLPQALQ